MCYSLSCCSKFLFFISLFFKFILSIYIVYTLYTHTMLYPHTLDLSFRYLDPPCHSCTCTSTLVTQFGNMNSYNEFHLHLQVFACNKLFRDFLFSFSGMVGLSSGEKRFIRGGIEQDLRPDGRRRLHYRPISIETGVIPQVPFCSFIVPNKDNYSFLFHRHVSGI